MGMSDYGLWGRVAGNSAVALYGCFPSSDGGPASKKAKLGHKTGRQPKAVVLDIEGTVAPISFVTETLFPYARAHVAQHLASSFETEETQADLDLLRQQVCTLTGIVDWCWSKHRVALLHTPSLMRGRCLHPCCLKPKG